MGGLGLLMRRRAMQSNSTGDNIKIDDILTSLLFRYSASEMTNEMLLANPIMTDLTGNGFNMTLQNVSFDGVTDGIMIDEDGERYLRLTRDRGGYASINASSLGYKMESIPDYTAIIRRRWFVNQGASSLLVVRGGNTNHQLCLIESMVDNVRFSQSRGFKDVEKVNITSAFQTDKRTIYQVTDSYNGEIYLPFNYNNNYLNIGSIDINSYVSRNAGTIDLYEMLFFAKKLTPEEISAVKKYFRIK